MIESNLPDKLTAVTADDEQWFKDLLTRVIMELNPNYNVIQVHSAKELLENVLVENNEQTPDVVFLDDHYGYSNEWRLQGSEKYTTTILEILRKHSNKDEELLDRLLSAPRSLSFATILRLMGYEGKIIVCSSSPPSLRDVNLFIEEFGLKNIPIPIDATTFKRPFGDNIFEYSVTNKTEQTLSPKYIEDGELKDSIRILLAL